MRNFLFAVLLVVTSISFAQDRPVIFGGVGASFSSFDNTGVYFQAGVNTVKAGDFQISTIAALQIMQETRTLNLNVIPTFDIYDTNDVEFQLGAGATFMKATRTFPESTTSFEMGAVVRGVVQLQNQDLFFYAENAIVSNGYDYLSLGVGFNF